MRIAVIGPTYPFKGGVALHTTQLALELAQAGHRVELQTWSRQYPKLLYPGQLEYDDPSAPRFEPVHRILRWDRPRSWVQVGRYIGVSCELAAIAVVTPIQVPSYLIMMRAARRVNPGIAVTAICHNVMPHERRPGDETLMRRMLRSSDRVVVHSPEEAAKASALGARTVITVPLPYHGPSGITARELGSAGRQRRLLFFGMIRPYKGVDVLLRALVEVPDVELVVAGEFWGAMEAQIRDVVAELKLVDRVDIRPGYISEGEVGPLFSTCDATVLPYLHATGSQQVEVSFRHGKPVIVSTAGSLAESVRPGVDGLVFPAGDVAALRTAIEELYAGDTLERLTKNVPMPNPDAGWSAYLRAVTGAPGAHHAQPLAE